MIRSESWKRIDRLEMLKTIAAEVNAGHSRVLTFVGDESSGRMAACDVAEAHLRDLGYTVHRATRSATTASGLTHMYRQIWRSLESGTHPPNAVPNSIATAPNGNDGILNAIAGLVSSGGGKVAFVFETIDEDLAIPLSIVASMRRLAVLGPVFAVAKQDSGTRFPVGFSRQELGWMPVSEILESLGTMPHVSEGVRDKVARLLGESAVAGRIPADDAYLIVESLLWEAA